MFTSDTKKYTKIALVYLVIAVFCGLFGAVYEQFSHGVYSGYMLYAFAFPLIGGTLPALIIALLGAKRQPEAVSVILYRCGIATFTVGSIIRGVLDIYGTTNVLINWYWYIGTALIVIASGIQLIRTACNRT